MMLRNKISPTIRIKLVYASAALACASALVVQIWFATAGTWFTLPTFPYSYDHYYNQLADAFLQGHTYLETPVNPLLLELPNPYNPGARGNLEFLWDTSLYEGKYYLYWGPMPSVIIMVIKLIYPGFIGDNLVVFAAVAIITIFQTLLLTWLWTQYFQRLPIWTLFIGVLMAGLIIPLNIMNNRPEIYEGAIISGQAFLMGGIYFAVLAVRPTEIFPRHLVAASMLWGCAVASRTIVVFEVIFASMLIGLLILNRPVGWAWRLKRLIAFGLPLALFAFGLGAYNFVRFGSAFEFGYKYQLTMFDFSKIGDELFSTRYMFPSMENYVLTAPHRIKTFPYFRPKAGDEIEFSVKSPDLYYIETITGVIYTFPFVIFALVPILRTLTKGVKLGKNTDTSEYILQWVVVLLSGMGVIAVTQLLSFFYTTMRYLADVTPILSVLALMGFWFGYQTVSSNKALRFAYAGIGVFLAGISIIVPNMLALVISERISTYSPNVLPALDALFKSVFLK